VLYTKTAVQHEKLHATVVAPTKLTTTQKVLVNCSNRVTVSIKSVRLGLYDGLAAARHGGGKLNVWLKIPTDRDATPPVDVPLRTFSKAVVSNKVPERKWRALIVHPFVQIVTDESDRQTERQTQSNSI